MGYDRASVIEPYELKAEEEDRAEKEPSLRVEIPREFIRRYLRADDVALDAGGGTGINAIMMAERCRQVTLLDITPGILRLAERNIQASGVADRIELVEGDITDLSRFADGTFTFVVCVGDAISYVLDQRFQAMAELVRVAREGAIVVIGCDSKWGHLRLKLADGLLDEALEVRRTGECAWDGWPRAHVYTVEEMESLLAGQGCQVLEVASTPTLADTLDAGLYAEPERWAELKRLELELCTRPELLGMGLHLLFVARKGRRSFGKA
jgi:SAM-dependent methyltransferase